MKHTGNITSIITVTGFTGTGVSIVYTTTTTTTTPFGV